MWAVVLTAALILGFLVGKRCADAGLRYQNSELRVEVWSARRRELMRNHPSMWGGKARHDS